MIILRFKKFLVVVLSIAVILSLNACSSRHEFFINVKAGDEYKFLTETSIYANYDIYGQITSTTQNTSKEFKILVDSLDSNGNSSLKYVYDYVKLESETDGTKEVYDSSNPIEDIYSKVYANLIGKSFNVNMTKYGKITELLGADEVIDDVVASLLPDDTDEEYLARVKNTLYSSFGNATMRPIIQLPTNIFPEKKKKVGDSWTIESTIISVAEIDMKTTYTLDKIENNIAYISVQSEFTSDKTKTHDYQGMDMKADLTGNTTGSIKIDITNGLLSEGEINQKIKGKMIVNIPSFMGSQEETMDIPMNSTTKTTYSITQK